MAGNAAIRDRIEHGFETFGRGVARHSALAVAICLLVGLGLSSYAPLLEVDTSTENLLAPDDPVRLRYEEFREQFGRDELIVVGIAGERVFARDFLARLAHLHADLEREVPRVVEITSLINARDVHGEGDELRVDDLLEEVPETDAELAALEARVIASPTYRDLLISRDGRFTAIVIETEAFTGESEDALAGFDSAPAESAAGNASSSQATRAKRHYLSGEENHEIVAGISEVVARHRAEGFEIYTAGTPLMIDVLSQLMQRDMRNFVVLSVALMSVLLYLLFGTLAGVLLPIAVVLLSLGALLGTMALLGQKIAPPTQILPTFQLTVGIAYPIHFLAIFFREFRAGASREDAVAHSIGHSGLPIVMTALTTAGGMASFVTAALYPIALLGYLVPLGVLLALLFSLVLLPGLVMIVPLGAANADRREAGDAPIDRFLLACGRLSLRHPRALIAGTLAVSLVSGIAASSLRFSHDPVDDWMPEGDPLRIATHVLNDRIGGVTSVDVLVRTGRENGLHEPEVLDGMDRLRAWAESGAHQGITVTRATSLVDIVKETNRALNENRAEAHAIPRERALVAQELLLFENSGADDLERIVDPSFSTARVTLRLPWGDAVDFYHFMRELDARVPALVGPDVGIVITGLVGMMSRTLMAVMESMAWSYVTSLVVVTLLMTAMLGNLRGGLVSMLPNLAPIFAMHGVMVAFDVPLDALTLMAGSTVLGLAVDDTIHFIHVFRREFEACGDARLAVDRTLTSTGRANLFSCIVLSSGFLVFTLSSMENLKNYGLLIAFTFLLALAIELLVTPALLVTTAVGAKNAARRREALAATR
jgi:hypothetical protein